MPPTLASDLPNPSVRNKRLSRRLSPRGGLKANCRRGTMDLGKDIALSVLDISEEGVRLMLSEVVKGREEVCLTLSSAICTRPVKRLGTVAWSVAAADGTVCAGVRLDKRLSYAEVSRLVRL
jgi:hypothetical protein